MQMHSWRRTSAHTLHSCGYIWWAKWRCGFIPQITNSRETSIYIEFNLSCLRHYVTSTPMRNMRKIVIKIAEYAYSYIQLRSECTALWSNSQNKPFMWSLLRCEETSIISLTDLNLRQQRNIEVTYNIYVRLITPIASMYNGAAKKILIYKKNAEGGCLEGKGWFRGTFGWESWTSNWSFAHQRTTRA